MGVSFRSPLRDAIWVTAAMVIGVSLLGGPASAGTAAPRTPSASPSASSGTVVITDDSHVLSQADVASLRSDASDIGPVTAGPEPVWIYTTTGLGGDKTAFDEHYKALLTSAPANVVIMAVDTKSRHMIITSGQDSGLSNTGADQARADFTNSFQGGSGYGRALSSALLRIRVSVVAGPSATYPATGDSTSDTSGVGTTFFIIFGLILLAVVCVVAKLKGRSSGDYAPGQRGYSNYSDQSLYQNSSSSFGDVSSGTTDSSGGGSTDGGGSGGGTSSGDF
jgi:uncharacterized membrane protein YgcG